MKKRSGFNFFSWSLGKAPLTTLTHRDFDWLVKRVAQLLEIEPKDVLAAGKYVKTVKARSLLCYWGVRELGMTTVELAKKVNLAQPTVSQAVSRGKKIAEKQGLNLIEQANQ